MAEVECQGVFPQPLSPRLTAHWWEERTATILTHRIVLNSFLDACCSIQPLWDPTWWWGGCEHQEAGSRSWRTDSKEDKGHWSIRQSHRAESDKRWRQFYEPTEILLHLCHFHFFLTHKREIWESLRRVRGRQDSEGQLKLQLWRQVICRLGMSSLAIEQGWRRWELSCVFEECKPENVLFLTWCDRHWKEREVPKSQGRQWLRAAPIKRQNTFLNVLQHTNSWM